MGTEVLKIARMVDIHDKNFSDGHIGTGYHQADSFQSGSFRNRESSYQQSQTIIPEDEEVITKLPVLKVEVFVIARVAINKVRAIIRDEEEVIKDPSMVAINVEDFNAVVDADLELLM